MVTKIIDRLRLDNNWLNLDLGKFNDCYLIAIKDSANKYDTIKTEGIKKVRFEVGIDSGIKGSPLTIQYITLDFTDITSGNNELNKITAFTRILNFPSQFYLKPVAIETINKTVTDGETSISINISPMNLG